MKIPFAKQPKLKAATVGNDAIGVFHLAERGGISPAENPVDVQQEILKQQKIAKIYRTAENKLAKDRSITLTEARKLLRNSAKDTVTADPVDYEELLTPEQIAELFTLQGSPKDFEVRVATLFLRYRVLYPVILAAPAHPDVPVLSIEPLGFELPTGSHIDFGKFKVTVSDYVEDGAESVAVKMISAKLTAGSVGYLMQSGQYKLGCTGEDPAEFEKMVQLLESAGFDRVKAENTATEFGRSSGLFHGWSDADTRLLDTALIHDVYRLYCREMGLPDPDLVEEEDAEDAEIPLEVEASQKIQSLSSGRKSTTESASLEEATV